jgi:2,3-bisphosphoglycerate-independent phosphoglycerate mutase
MKTLKTLFLLILVSTGFARANAGPGTLGTAITNVTGAYLGIKNALVANNATEAENKALDLVKAINAVPEKSMTADQQKTWALYVNKLLFDSRHISESNPVAHKREHFASLSTNLFDVLKAFKLNTAPLYKQYCPMKKAYWISETNTIKNPYYGTGSMETCGVTKDELKPEIR